jgi:hypothetical protein
VVDWWDWGTWEDHRNTVIKVSMFGSVTYPIDDYGRPKLVVPACNEAMITYRGKETNA